MAAEIVTNLHSAGASNGGWSNQWRLELVLTFLLLARAMAAEFVTNLPSAGGRPMAADLFTKTKSAGGECHENFTALRWKI